MLLNDHLSMITKSNMVQIHVAELSRYYGSFSWHDVTLWENIKRNNRDYDTSDPRTWPLIQEFFVRDIATHNKQPPTAVAYSRVAMDTINQANPAWTWLTPGPTKHKTYEQKKINSRFLAYPYNFARDGTQRLEVGIPKADLESWMDFVNTPGKRGKARAVVSKSIPGMTNNAAIEIHPPATTYDRIMETLAEQKAPTSTTATLKEQLRQAEERCQREKERADKAEQQNTALKQEHDKALVQERLDSSLALEQQRDRTMSALQDLHNQRFWAMKAEDKVRALEKGVDKLDCEVAEAKQEAKDANERIEKIWEEMQKGKRKATDEAEGAQQKKARLDT